MSERLQNLKMRYLNSLYLEDDIGKQGVIYTNYKVSVVKRWIALFRGSKYCTITHDPPKIITIDYKGKDDAVKNLLKDVDIPEEKKRKLCYFPSYVSVPKENIFELNKFINYLKDRNLDHEFLTRKEHDSELPKRRKKLIKINKKKRWH